MTAAHETAAVEYDTARAVMDRWRDPSTPPVGAAAAEERLTAAERRLAEMAPDGGVLR